MVDVIFVSHNLKLFFSHNSTDISMFLKRNVFETRCTSGTAVTKLQFEKKCQKTRNMLKSPFSDFYLGKRSQVIWKSQ